MSLLRTDLHCLVSSSLLPALNRFFSHHNIHRTCSLAGVLFVSNQREHVVMFCHQVLLLRTCITPPSYRDNPLLPDPVDRLEQNERFSCNSISFPTNPWFYCPTHCWATFNFFHCDAVVGQKFIFRQAALHSVKGSSTNKYVDTCTSKNKTTWRYIFLCVNIHWYFHSSLGFRWITQSSIFVLNFRSKSTSIALQTPEGFN